jgi:hypothetical protein
MNAFDVPVARYTKNPVTTATPGVPFVDFHVNLKASTAYPRGSQLGPVTASPGTFGIYASGNTDGTQSPSCVLLDACSTDASGNITLGSNADPAYRTVPSVPACFSGHVRCEDVVGLTSASAAILGKLIYGTTTVGILRVG